jgi:hypothetical protein
LFAKQAFERRIGRNDSLECDDVAKERDVAVPIVGVEVSRRRSAGRDHENGEDDGTGSGSHHD